MFRKSFIILSHLAWFLTLPPPFVYGGLFFLLKYKEGICCSELVKGRFRVKGKSIFNDDNLRGDLSCL